jgi:serine phosphatase RsbU (regulator of sigma subunit)/anti-sigma regulatory factor (Ser/Thr protein kinase)
MRRWLPRGNTLPDEHWTRRHRGIVALLWAHAAVIPVYGLLRDVSPLHIAVESLVLPIAAGFASWPRLSRRQRTLAASSGLLTASAILVHFSGGLIEMHFHFFVMVAVVSLYQDWMPFLAAVAYVFVHHAVLGSVDPESVFNHPAAVNHPWRWAGIHALFIAGISLACLVTWRLNEEMMDRRRDAEERLREETQIVETLNHIGRTLTAELDLHAVLQRVTDAATDVTSAQFGAFFYNEVDEAGEAYQLYTLSGVSVEAFDGFPMPRATSVFAPTFKGEGVVRYDDVTREPMFGQSAPHFGMPPGHLPVRSYLAVPVIARDGDVYGGLFFGHPEAGRFDRMDERMVVGIASHATIAIENARLYDSQRTALATAEIARRRVEILAKAGQVLASSIEVEHTLADLTRLVATDVADSCAVYLLDGDQQLEPVAAHADYPAAHGEFGRDSIDVDHPVHPVAEVVRSGTPQYLQEIPSELIDGSIDDASDRAFVHQHRPTSAIIVPMRGRAKRDVIGALALGTVEQSGRRLTQADFDLAEELARRAAVAVEHARLYRAQRDVAETLQHSLLPEELPVIPGMQAAARYMPGGPDVEVGGDWYDMVTFADGALGIVMGDVVGRGVPAASLMGQLRNALRAYALEDKDPCVVLQRLNAFMNDLGPSQSMATLLYGVFDLDSSSLTLSNAGHPPPLIVDDKREACFVEGGLGPPLGAVVSPTFTNVTVQLPPGSTLFTYTDGLVEDRSTPLSVGLSLMEALVASGPKDLEDLCDYVMASALAGRSGGDDAALLALRVLPVQAEVHLTLPRRPDVIRALRTTLRRQLRSVGATKQEEFEILVATGEACANAIQHAGPASSTFDFEASVGDEVRIVVRDHGRWREGRPADGGRGLSIMDQFMDEVEVNHADGGTEVLLRRVLEGVQPGGDE